MSGFGRFCCKSLFALVIKISFGCTRSRDGGRRGHLAFIPDDFRGAGGFPAAQRPPRNPGISLTQAPQRAQYSTRLCAPRSTTCRDCRVTTALNNQGDQCEIATWISPHHDPAWAIRRTGVIPASSVRRDQWCHIEYADFERANFCSAGNKSGQFQPGDDHALSERSPPRGFNFNCHRM
jgi:hypothetical protein